MSTKQECSKCGVCLFESECRNGGLCSYCRQKPSPPKEKNMGMGGDLQAASILNARNALDSLSPDDLVTILGEYDRSTRTGHPDFYRIIEEMKALHEKKAADYGLGKDILANCRGSTEFGMAAWIGVAMRMNDKMTRLKSFAQKGSLANESVEDSLLDLANYSILALILYREASK